MKPVRMIPPQRITPDLITGVQRMSRERLEKEFIATMQLKSLDHFINEGCYEQAIKVVDYLRKKLRKTEQKLNKLKARLN